MVKDKYYPPILYERQFHCPHCNVYSKQIWAYAHGQSHLTWTGLANLETFSGYLGTDWYISRCVHCGESAIWHDGNLIYPDVQIIAPPNEDLSDDIKHDYLEAASILNKSPRASGALLRLALQKLCVQLGGKGNNINDDIKSFVDQGLNPLLQKSLDALRITGNNAVHPGEINIAEEPDRVLKLFGLINFIAEKMISEPKQITDFYEELPVGAKEAVKRRDG